MMINKINQSLINIINIVIIKYQFNELKIDFANFGQGLSFNS